MTKRRQQQPQPPQQPRPVQKQTSKCIPGTAINLIMDGLTPHRTSAFDMGRHDVLYGTESRESMFVLHSERVSYTKGWNVELMDAVSASRPTLRDDF